MSKLKFAETHNLVAFLEKPKESDGLEGIIDFLNASSIRYALTVNPTIYTSCIKQLCATAKAKDQAMRSAYTMPYPRRKNQGGNRGKTLRFLNPVVLQSLSLMRLPMRSMYLYIPMIHYSVEKVKKLERRSKSRTLGLKRLKKVGRTARIESSEDEEVTLVDEAQGRIDGNLMFDIGVFDEQEVEVEKVVNTAKVTTASTTTTTVDELTLAQTLIEIKAAKP
ncbi:hypothetical protein Tco_0737654 [Tanacetum coccineum]